MTARVGAIPAVLLLLAAILLNFEKVFVVHGNVTATLGAVLGVLLVELLVSALEDIAVGEREVSGEQRAVAVHITEEPESTRSSLLREFAVENEGNLALEVLVVIVETLDVPLEVEVVGIDDMSSVVFVVVAAVDHDEVIDTVTVLAFHEGSHCVAADELVAVTRRGTRKRVLRILGGTVIEHLQVL